MGNQAVSTACVREAMCCCKMRHLKGLDLGGVDGLRARGEGQLQDALCAGLEGTVSEPQSLQSLVMAMDSYNWTAHTTSSATRSRERHCFESDTASIATSLRERHNFERDTASRATQLRELYNFESDLPSRATPFRERHNFESDTTSRATEFQERPNFESDVFAFVH